MKDRDRIRLRGRGMRRRFLASAGNRPDGGRRSLIWVLIAVLWGFTVGSLLLAILSFFSWVAAATLGAALALIMFRLLPLRFNKNIPRGLWGLAILIAVASAALNSPFPSEELITGRDGGTYLATAAWLAGNGTLEVDTQPEAWGDIDGLVLSVPGFGDSGNDGTLAPQFLHAFPSVTAAAYQLGGIQAAMRVNAVLGGVGLLLVFSFASSLMRPWLALIVQLGLAVNLVFVFYSRAPLSEMMALAFVFAGLTALWHGQQELSTRSGLAAGLLLGTTLATRIDALVLLIPVVGIALFRRRQSDESSFWSATLIGLLVMGLIAGIDVAVVDPSYLGVNKSPVIMALIGLVLVVGASIVWSAHSGVFGRFLGRHRRRVAWIASGLIVTGAIFVLAVRPHLAPVYGDPYGLASIQEYQGLPLEPNRIYSESTGWWLWWYVGPVVVVAILGWALLTFHQIEGADRRALPFLLVFSAFCVLYVWRPSINPDHIWVMRRYLPVVIPGLLVTAAWFVDQLPFERLRRAAPAALGATALLMLIGPLPVLIPAVGIHELDGFASDFSNACRKLGDQTAVVVVDANGRLGGATIQSFRSYCGIPAAAIPDETSLARIASGWSELGRSLWVVRWYEAHLEGEVLIDAEYVQLEKTLTRPPRGESTFPIRLVASEAP